MNFGSFDEYVQWSQAQLREKIEGLSEGRLIEEVNHPNYRCLTYEFTLEDGRTFQLDFEKEGDVEWYTGNQQEDPDWVYSPAKGEVRTWGGAARLAERLNGERHQPPV
jgi:hypothetical protein